MVKEKPPINELPAMPHGNPKSLDSSSHIQRVTLKEPHKSISASRKVHIGSACVYVCRFDCNVCTRVCSHLCPHCALASGTRLTPESRGADRDRPIRINYTSHTEGLLAHFTLTLTVRTTRMQDLHTHTHTYTHTHITLTFRMNISCVLLSMTKRTCDGRVPLIAR